MRVLIRKPLAGVVGGISLSRFAAGVVYDVDPYVGRQLVSMGAERIDNPLPAIGDPHSERAPLSDEQLTGGITVIPGPPDRADDRARRRNTGKKRR